MFHGRKFTETEGADSPAGPNYETALCLFFLIKSTLKRFHLEIGKNFEELRMFDDVYFRYEDCGKIHLMLIQAKNSQTQKMVNMKKLVLIGFNTYTRIREDVENLKSLTGVKFKNIHFIIYTNGIVNENLLGDFKQIKFNPTLIPNFNQRKMLHADKWLHGCANVQDSDIFQEYLCNLTIMCEQPNEHDILNLIVNEIQDIFPNSAEKAMKWFYKLSKHFHDRTKEIKTITHENQYDIFDEDEMNALQSWARMLDGSADEEIYNIYGSIFFKSRYWITMDVLNQLNYIGRMPIYDDDDVDIDYEDLIYNNII